MKDKDMSTLTMTKTHTFFNSVQRFASATFALTAAFLVAACGGGGGSSSAPVPVVANSVSDLVGRWENPAANWDAKWLAPVSGQTVSPIWLLSRDGSSMSYLEGTIAADGTVSATGKRYALNVAGEGTVPVSQTWNAKATTLSGQTRLSFSDGTTLTRSAAQALVVQSDVTGAWTSQLGNGLLTLNYSVDAQGVLKGNSTTGCTYVGYVVIRANSFVYDARLSETCTDGVEKLLNGIGSLATDKARLTLTLLGPSGAYAKALYLSKN